MRTKGCAGMAYHLEYVDAPGKLDDVVEQDGVKVVIDSKALMTIIGSEMDWVEDRLRLVCVREGEPKRCNRAHHPFTLHALSSFSAKFTFHNPNVVVSSTVSYDSFSLTA